MGLVIGLTGGIATGKTLVSNIFKRLGARVIDLDEIAREVVRPGLPAWREIVEAFGQGILIQGGEIDRKRLGEIVFNNPDLLKKLNAITHPRILEEARRRIERIRREEPDAIIIVDAALLVESGYHQEMDRVIVVYADEEVQLERLMRRNGLSREEAEKRVRAQMPIEEKLSYADYVIQNNGSVEETEREVIDLFKRLKEET